MKYNGREYDEMILRDYLAYERTILARKRTILAYMRTILAFLSGGLGLVTIIDTTLAEIIGYVLITISVIVFIFCIVDLIKIKTDRPR